MLNETQENMLNEAKLLMCLADQQEKSADKATQLEAEHNRRRLLKLLTQLHIVNPAGSDDESIENQDKELAQQWDDWVIQHAAPGADILGRLPYTGDCGTRILQYVTQAEGFEGTMGRLANAVGAAKSTVHDALLKLAKANKVSVEKTSQRKFIVTAV